MRTSILAAFALLSLSVHAHDPVWLTYGAEGVTARTIVGKTAECPHITIDGRRERMHVRALPGPNYAVTSCEAMVPEGAKAVSIGDQALPAHKLGRHARIAILGDTGCRRKLGSNGKPPSIQDCKDPKAWPFKAVADSIADWDPDLILDVGDYYYREAVKSANGQWVKSTYDWSRWNADWFTPADRLLPNAPWVMVRGNHESCDRAAEGWFRFLDTRRYSYENQKQCKSNLDWTPPYELRVGDLRFLVFDSAAIADWKVDETQLDIVVNQLGLYAGKGADAWMLLHHPFWAHNKGGDETEVMWTAWTKAGAKVPDPELMLNGHMHLLEMLSFADKRIPQLVVGNGGTALDSAPDDPTMPIGGRTVADFYAHDDFGWVAATREGANWTFEIRDTKGKTKATCAWSEGNALACSSK